MLNGKEKSCTIDTHGEAKDHESRPDALKITQAGLTLNLCAVI